MLPVVSDDEDSPGSVTGGGQPAIPQLPAPAPAQPATPPPLPPALLLDPDPAPAPPGGLPDGSLIGIGTRPLLNDKIHLVNGGSLVLCSWMQMTLMRMLMSLAPHLRLFLNPMQMWCIRRINKSGIKLLSTSWMHRGKMAHGFSFPGLQINLSLVLSGSLHANIMLMAPLITTRLVLSPKALTSILASSISRSLLLLSAYPLCALSLPLQLSMTGISGLLTSLMLISMGRLTARSTWSSWLVLGKETRRRSFASLRKHCMRLSKVEIDGITNCTLFLDLWALHWPILMQLSNWVSPWTSRLSSTSTPVCYMGGEASRTSWANEASRLALVLAQRCGEQGYHFTQLCSHWSDACWSIDQGFDKHRKLVGVG